MQRNNRLSLLDPSRIFSDNFIDSFFNTPTIMGDDWSSVKMDMYEDKDNVVVELQIPGFKEDDIEINIEDNVLTVSGTSEEKTEESKGKKYYYKGIRKESFSRTFRLPSKVMGEKSNAEFRNGELIITLPKAEDAKPKRISIKAGK